MDSLLRVQNRIDEITRRFEPVPARARPGQTDEGAKNGTDPSVARPEHSRGMKFSAMLDRMIEKESRDQGVAPDLVRAVVQAESGGNPSAISPKGALGLMQLMPDTARALGVDPSSPSENLQGGIRYLRSLAAKYGDLDRTLAAYNAGPGAVDRWKGVPPYPETQQYVHRIKKTLLGHARD